jgi:hypothetical protein
MPFGEISSACEIGKKHVIKLEKFVEWILPCAFVILGYPNGYPFV